MVRRVFYLSDRGIRQAIDRGLIRFDTPCVDSQFQPASLDLLLGEIEEVWPLPLMERRYHKRNVRDDSPWLLPAFTEVGLVATQAMQCAKPLRADIELRSSLRRLGPFHGSHGMRMITYGDKAYVEVKNPGPISLGMVPGKSFAQAIFYFVEQNVQPGVWWMELADKVMYEMMCSLDHGRSVRSDMELAWVLLEDYLQIRPRSSFRDGLLTIHAGNTAKVLRKELLVDLSSKAGLDEYIRDVKLPYLLKPGEMVWVDTKESFKLSRHVAIQFYDHMPGTSRALRFQDIDWDGQLWHMPDGWIDPGYEGTMSRQPKTMDPAGVIIRPGDVLGHGVVIYYPNGVDRPYGSSGLGSHYQGQKSTKLTQE